MKHNEIASRFFNGDRNLCNAVNLTDEEVKLFEMFELEVLCVNGLRQINGGWSAIEILDEYEEDDETENEILVCKACCGVQDEDGKELNERTVKFDRVTKKFKYN